jgi:hypothetical protein
MNRIRPACMSQPISTPTIQTHPNEQPGRSIVFQLPFRRVSSCLFSMPISLSCRLSNSPIESRVCHKPQLKHSQVDFNPSPTSPPPFLSIQLHRRLSYNPYIPPLQLPYFILDLHFTAPLTSKVPFARRESGVLVFRFGGGYSI